MTRKEAIRHLAHLQTIGTLSDETLSAFALAEKALETENAVIDRILEIIDEESTRNGLNLKQTAEIRRRVLALKGEQG